MTDKLDFYDILGIIVPGLLLLLLGPQLFPSITPYVRYASYPDAFTVIALTALAIFAGHLVQALGSLLEPFFNLTWGGRPSETALAGGLGQRYLPQDTADRIKKKLTTCVGPGATDRSLFPYSMQRSEGSGRTSRFNALYAYHRGLLAVWLICCIALTSSMIWGGLAASSRGVKGLLMLVACSLLLLIWYRTKQRALYYVREVLLTTERILDDLDREDQKKNQAQCAKG